MNLPHPYKWAYLLYISLALSLTVFHTLAINREFWPQRSEFHLGIVQGDFKSPYQYRVLAPFLAEAGGQLLDRLLGMPDGKASILLRELMYSGLRFIATAIALICFHKYLETWLSMELAFAGTIFLYGLHLYTFRSYHYQPSSFLHLMFMILGAYLTLKGKVIWLYPLVILASLARETAGMVIILYIAQYWRQKGWFRTALVLFLLWLSAQMGLRFIFDLAPSFPSRPLAMNFYYYILPWPVFLYGLLWILPLFSWKNLPPFLRRSIVLAVPPLMVANLLFGKVEETRLFLELSILYIPVALVFIFPDSALRATRGNIPASDIAV